MDYLTKLKLRSESKIRTREGEIAARVEKELGIPEDKIRWGCLLAREGNWIGKDGVEIALAESKEGKNPAALFWKIVNGQKENIIWS